MTHVNDKDVFLMTWPQGSNDGKLSFVANESVFIKPQDIIEVPPPNKHHQKRAYKIISITQTKPYGNSGQFYIHAIGIRLAP